MSIIALILTILYLVAVLNAIIMYFLDSYFVLKDFVDKDALTLPLEALFSF